VGLVLAAARIEWRTAWMEAHGPYEGVLEVDAEVRDVVLDPETRLLARRRVEGAR
jgi:hypothetical protein